MFGESYFSFFNFILAPSIVPSPWTNNEMWPFWLPTPCLPLLCFFWVSFQYLCISFLYLLHCHSLLPHHLNPCQCHHKLWLWQPSGAYVSKMIPASDQSSFFNSWMCFLRPKNYRSKLCPWWEEWSVCQECVFGWERSRKLLRMCPMETLLLWSIRINSSLKMLHWSIKKELMHGNLLLNWLVACTLPRHSVDNVRS